MSTVPQNHFISRRAFALLTMLLCAVLAAGLVRAPAASAENALFTVKGVKVDVTAQSAAAAREQAFAQAQQLAFDELAGRILPEADKEHFTPPDLATISSFVNDFEITNERLSSVRYIGTYTFRFKDRAVRTFFSGTGFNYTDVSSRPVLVLPYYKWGAQLILWGDENPWREAWGRQTSAHGLVPIIIPIGDLADVSDMDDNMALTYEPRALERMVARYRAGEALIAIATPGWQGAVADTVGTVPAPRSIEVAMYQTGASIPEFSQNVMINESDVRDGETIYDAAARKVRETLQSDWKDKTLVSARQGNKLRVRVRFQNMREWIATQSALSRVQGVNRVELVSLSPSEAQVDLVFRGDEGRLRLALAQADMTLTTPSVDFSAMNQASGHSPLIYDIYLNRFAPDRY